MNINAELIRQQRSDRNWTQQILADACGVSLRTIQRVERYGNASGETVMALASVFEVEQSSIICPENPVVELDITKQESSMQVGQVLKYVLTLTAGMLIGASIVMFTR